MRLLRLCRSLIALFRGCCVIASRRHLVGTLLHCLRFFLVPLAVSLAQTARPCVFSFAVGCRILIRLSLLSLRTDVATWLLNLLSCLRILSCRLLNGIGIVRLKLDLPFAHRRLLTRIGITGIFIDLPFFVCRGRLLGDD